MTANTIDYSAMMHGALLGIVRDVLTQAAEHGLAGDHHFYLTFETQYPGVVIPSHLSERHPNTMTIVLQHQFWDLVVVGNGFSVGLSFNGRQETLHIPFDALTAFMDPSVQFGLQLRDVPEDDEELVDVSQPPAVAENLATEPQASDDVEPSAIEEGDEEAKDNVITLDRFRNS